MKFLASIDISHIPGNAILSLLNKHSVSGLFEPSPLRLQALRELRDSAARIRWRLIRSPREIRQALSGATPSQRHLG